MSDLSYMEKLLDGVEVEWKPLGEVCNFKNGFAFKSSLFRDTGLPIIRITNVDGKNVDLSDVKYFDPTDYTSGNPLNYSVVKGDILIAMSGATTGKIGYFNLDEIAYLNQRVGKFEPRIEIINNRYLYHFLLTKTSFLHMLSGGGAQPNLSSNNLKEKLLVPIPCPSNPKKSLEIQAEIVRILDAFTELTAELTAELVARKQQYAYYSEKLLTANENNVEWEELGKIGNFTYGYVAKAQDTGNARFVRISDIDFSGKLIAVNAKYVDILESNEKFILRRNDLLMARTGATYGKTMLFEENYPAIYAGFLIKLSFDENIIDPKYYWHFAQSTLFWSQAKKLVSGGGQPQFNANVLKLVKIPIPSLLEQQRIVAILDKFDALTTSLTEGLPREIELRQQQYEYYRELLLSFPKPEVANHD
ncbi:restriction endonuclease subunit S [Psychrobacter sp.]|uniref:restriction endonuclease subunit S n=1 Tax=Psychrobacter sp. TaxID=56811 RepID=UPI002FD8C688